MPEEAHTAAMNPSQRNGRTTFWLVAIACYVISIFVVMPLLHRFHLGKYNNGFAAPSIILSFLIATLATRRKGVPLSQQKIRVLERIPNVQSDVSAEMHMSRTGFRWLSLFFSACFLLFVYSGKVSPPKPGEVLSFVRVLCVLGVWTLFLGAFGWIRSSLVMRVDKEGIVTLRGLNKRKLLPWEQIARCREVENEFTATGFKYCVWTFEDDTGKPLLQVTPVEEQSTQRDDFAVALSHYLKPPSAP